MPIQNNYKHYPLSNLKKKSTVVSTFLGVDFSSQRFNVSSSRAINIKNFIYKDGVIQKRCGYEEIFKVKQVEYFDKFTNKYNVNGVNFNGMWKFEAEDGLVHIVAHIGNLLFEIKNIESQDDISIEPLVLTADIAAGSGLNNSGTAVSGKDVLYKFEDYKSFAFVGANRLWFLGGNKYMCVRFTKSGLRIYPVEDQFSTGYGEEDAFVPTTCYNITYADAVVQSRVPLDFPNKLNRFRRNKLLSGVGKDKTLEEVTKYYEYTLDAPILVKDDSDYGKISIVIVDRKENKGE